LALTADSVAWTSASARAVSMGAMRGMSEILVFDRAGLHSAYMEDYG
jgi:hypothetical protein